MLPTDGVNYLVGKAQLSTRPFVPYAPLVCEFLNALSSELRTSKEATAYPDVMTLAFWCRKAHLAQLKAVFEQDGKTRLGLGAIFHIAPANVPINFAFSYVFGLLSGNANIVRVPSKSFPQIDLICKVINNLFQNEKYQEIKAMTAFVRYTANDEVTAMFSKDCNARIIWGGDETIKAIRKSPIPERSVEITFADRYSFCMMDASAVIALNEKQLNELAKHFYNDTYLMDQNACSSPHLIIWCGKEIKMAQLKFWTAVSGVVEENYLLEEVFAVDKYTLFCQDAIKLDHIKAFHRYGNFLYRLAMDKLPENVDELRGKCGYFFEYHLQDKENLIHAISNKCQTITYFGIDPVELKDFIVTRRLSGVDRIVPIGKALDIGVIWDGIDVIKSLSRIIMV